MRSALPRFGKRALRPASRAPGCSHEAISRSVEAVWRDIQLNVSCGFEVFIFAARVMEARWQSSAVSKARCGEGDVKVMNVEVGRLK